MYYYKSCAYIIYIVISNLMYYHWLATCIVLHIYIYIVLYDLLQILISNLVSLISKLFKNGINIIRSENG